MKKRTKVSLRTKIYLTMAGLLGLTAAVYATGHPVFFAPLNQATGIAISPSRLYATQFCGQGLFAFDCLGNATVVETIPLGNEQCMEKYMSIAPLQSIAAGFTPTDLFISEGQFVFKFTAPAGPLTFFTSLPPGGACQFADHTSLKFDKVGTFGFKLTMTCEGGDAFTIDGSGNVTLIGTFLDATHNVHVEGQEVANSSFGPLAGKLLAADENLQCVDAMDNLGNVTYNVFNFPAGFAKGAENIRNIPTNPCTFGCNSAGPGVFFQNLEDANSIILYPPTDFTGLGGSMILTTEAAPPDTTTGNILIQFNTATNSYDSSVFNSATINATINEGAQFVDCDAVTPTPTPTATATFTPTPTATFTPTATATATATSTPTATATATATPTPTPTPTVTPTTCTALFVIGDLDAVVGNHVTFWSKQWWKDNHLSGVDRSPPSFKGFVTCTNNPPTCGDTWQGDPGNSGHPPDTIPADITVIVSSSITKSGSTESGNIVKLVTVHVDPCCYGQPVEAPGHEGRGIVTAVVCQTARPQRPARPPR